MNPEDLTEVITEQYEDVIVAGFDDFKKLQRNKFEDQLQEK